MMKSQLRKYVDEGEMENELPTRFCHWRVGIASGDGIAKRIPNHEFLLINDKMQALRLRGNQRADNANKGEEVNRQTRRQKRKL